MGEITKTSNVSRRSVTKTKAKSKYLATELSLNNQAKTVNNFISLKLSDERSFNYCQNLSVVTLVRDK